MARYGNEFFAGRNEWGRGSARGGYAGDYGFRSEPGRRNRYGTHEPAWREGRNFGGYRGRSAGENWRGGYGSQFYGRRGSMAPSYGRGGWGGRYANTGSPGWTGSNRFTSRPAYGPNRSFTGSTFGTSRGYAGGRNYGMNRGGMNRGYGEEYRMGRSGMNEYDRDFGDRLQHGWHELKRGVRGMFGGHDYGREYRGR